MSEGSDVKMIYTAVGHEYPNLEEEEPAEPEPSAPEPEPEPEPVYPNRVVFVALGTRGDVQPVLAVALAYARAHRSCDVVLATHVELHDVIERLILSASGDSRTLVSLSPIRSGCFRREIRDSDRLSNLSQKKKNRVHTIDDTNAEFLKSISETYEPTPRGKRRKLNLARDDETNAESEQKTDVSAAYAQAHFWSNTRHHEMEDIITSCDGAELIVFNLFAMSAYHVAEWRGVACAAVSPYVIPYDKPSTFSRSFAHAYPHLHQKLEASYLDAAGEQCSWGEISHWLWPLFSSEHGFIREKYLYLSRVPLCNPKNDEPLSRLPPPPPLAYGVSPQVLARPAFFPRSVSVTGSWFVDTRMEQFKPPQSLVDFLEDKSNASASIGAIPEMSMEEVSAQAESSRRKSAPIFFGFGSMGAAGLGETHSSGFAKVVVNCLKLMKRRGFIIASQFKMVPREFWKDAEENGSLYVLEKVDIPYSWLFPKCALCVHHGGSGTFAEALRAGVPQLVMPIMFDQFYWAEKVQDLGVGDRLSFSGLNLVTMTHSVKHALSTRFRVRAQEVASNMRGEIDFARHCVVEILDNAFHRFQAYAENYPEELSGMPQWPYPHRVSLRAPTPFIGPAMPSTSPSSSSAMSASSSRTYNSKLRAHPDRLASRFGLQSCSASSSARKSNSDSDAIPFFHSKSSSSASAETENPRKRAHREAEAFAGRTIPNRNTTLVPYTDDGGAPQSKANSPLELYSFMDEETVFMHSEIFVRNCYLEDFLSIENGATIVDVGANLGLFLLYIGRRIESFSAIAFEPIPPIFHTLEQNLTMNGISVVLEPDEGSAAEEVPDDEHEDLSNPQQDNPGSETSHPESVSSFTDAMRCDEDESPKSKKSVKILRCALSSEPSTGEPFVFYPNTCANSTRKSLVAEKESQKSAFRHPGVALRRPVTFECAVNTLSNVLDNEKVAQVDLLKIDVEGSELSVLEGISSAHFANIRQVSVEVFSSERRDAVLALLARQGFEVRVNESPEVPDSYVVLARKLNAAKKMR